MRIGYRGRIIALATTCSLLTGLLGAVGYLAVVTLATSLSEVTVTGTALRNHLEGDMMHDALRADVFAAMVAGEEADEDEKKGIRRDTTSHAMIFRETLAKNGALPLNVKIKEHLSRLEPRLLAYAAQAEAMVELTLNDRAAAKVALGQFIEEFKALEGEQENITQAIQSWVQAADAASQQTTKITKELIVSAAAIAFALVLFMSATTIRAIVGPLVAIARAVRLLAHGDDTVKVTDYGVDDEIGTLIAALEDYRDKSQQLRTLFHAADQSPLSVVITDFLGMIEYANPSYCRTMGYAMSDIIGNTLRVTDPELTPAAVDDDLLRTITAGDNWVGELCSRRNDGERFWENVTISPVRGNDGSIRHFVTFREDQTEMRRRIREEAEARFNVVMDNVGEGVVVIDQRGCIESINKATEHTFGYSANEIIGANVSILMAPTDAAYHDRTLDRYLSTGEGKILGVGRELFARRKDGEIFSIELALGEVASGAERRFIGIIRDISQRKHAEQELRESENRFRDLAGSASDWFWETDADYRLSYVSERIASVLGVKPDAIRGHTFFEIGLGDHDPGQAFDHRNDLAQRRPFRDVVFHVGPATGKDSKTIRISGTPIFDGDTEFIGYRGVGVDVTREAAAEFRAKLAQQQLADAIESLVDGIAVFDAEDRLTVCNAEFRRAFANLDNLIEPGISFPAIIDACRNGNAFDSEGLGYESWKERRLAHHRQASGEPFIIHMANGQWILSREYRTQDGGVVGVQTDITEMKRREQELDTLRRRYALILDSAGEGIVGLNADGSITFANRTAGTMLGYAPEQMIGNYFDRLVQAPNIPPIAPSAILRPNNAEQVCDDVFWRSDGHSFQVEYLAAPIVEDGQVAGAVVVFRDVTLRLQYEQALANQHRELERLVAERTSELTEEVQVRTRTEAALRGSRERLKGITDSLFEGVLVVNRFGYLVFANPSAKRLLDCEAVAGDLEGHPLDSLFMVRMANRDLPFTEAPWYRVTTEGVTLRDDDAVFVTATGKTLSVAYACSPLSEDGGRRAAIISFRDIEALKHAQRDALQASRLASVGQLAAGIAHEINTPIQFIGDNLRFISDSVGELVGVLAAAKETATRAAGHAELADTVAHFERTAKQADLPYLMEEIPVAVRQSLEGVSQVARIVLSMKEFSHPGTGSKALVDINHALDTTLTVSRNTWRHAAEISRKFDPALPLVPCYAGEMNQVFLNLIVNAAHAIESSGKPLPGVITISTSHKDGLVEILIADTGTGVPDALRERIFDHFFTTKDVGQGTGQGLAICRDVVATKHGGRLDVGGIEGEGAVFIIRLPLGNPAERSDT